MSAETGIPNACNGCHLDRTLAWADENLARWYQTARTAVSDDDRNTAASLVHLLAGDASQRAIAAWSFGWEPARASADLTWAPRFLLATLADEYPAVRLAAFRSLQAYPGFAGTHFDYLAELDVRTRQIEVLTALLAPAERAGAPSIRLLDADPGPIPDEARMRDLLARQDRREVYISE